MKSLTANWIFSIIAVLGFAVPAFATDGENAGAVTNHITVHTLNGQQVWELGLNGNDGVPLNTLCPGHNFVYLNESDNNASTVFNTMQAADRFRSTLYVFWTTDAAGNCHITRVYW